MTPFRRNVPLLAVSQALMMSANSLIIATSALVGAALAPDPALATLPLALQFVAIMLTTIPAALLMGRIGRQAGFMLATLLGFAGGALTTQAIIHGEFWWFVAGTACIGAFNGFGNYYRFAAADAVDAAHKGRAISYVMIGGVVAAIVGPNLANHTRDLLAATPFAGSYASLMVIYVLALLTASALRLPRPAAPVAGDSEARARPLLVIVRQPRFVVALIGGMFGYGVMSLVMTATPLAMVACGQPFGETAFVIEWHVLGMFAPSFFTGHLIRWLGVLPVMLVGALLGIACVVINLNGDSVWHFWSALLLLGISWNFLFVGATTLLTETYRPSEQAKAQAVNDFAVFTTVSLASLSAGALQHHLGWRMVNIGVLPLLLLIIASIAWLHWRQTSTAEDRGAAQANS